MELLLIETPDLLREALPKVKILEAAAHLNCVPSLEAGNEATTRLQRGYNEATTRLHNTFRETVRAIRVWGEATFTRILVETFVTRF